MVFAFSNSLDPDHTSNPRDVARPSCTARPKHLQTSSPLINSRQFAGWIHDRIAGLRTRKLRIILRNMRKTRPLDALFPKTRQAVLATVYLEPTQRCVCIRLDSSPGRDACERRRPHDCRPDRARRARPSPERGRDNAPSSGEPVHLHTERDCEETRIGHHFLSTVMSSEKLFVIGDDDDLATATERKRLDG